MGSFGEGCSAVGRCSCSRMALWGLSSRSGLRGESWPSSGRPGVGGAVVGGAAEARRVSHSARSRFSLHSQLVLRYRRCLITTYRSSSRSSSSAFATLAMFRGFGLFRKGTRGGASSSLENQSLRMPFVTRSEASSSWMTRAIRTSAPPPQDTCVSLNIPACNA